MKIKTRRAFVKRLRRIPVEVKKQVKKDIIIGAEEMVFVAKRIAPKGDDYDLVSTIGHKATVGARGALGGAKTQGGLLGDQGLSRVVYAGGTATITQGANGPYDYAMAQELGTQNMEANPFFWPAYRLTKRRRNSRVTRNANKIIKRIFGGSK